MRTFIAALLGATLALGACAVHAAASELEKAQQRLHELRQMPHKGERPALSGFSPAQAVKGVEAPPGQHEHTQAYRSAKGCVAFFFPLGPKAADVAFKWSGAACKGQLLEGQGELQVRRRVGDTTVVAVLVGPFKGGMLTGEAVKAYFYYDKAGKALPGVNIMRGTFANSVLHGEGTARWSGAADERPSAWHREGTFKDGSLQGGGVLARLRPYPGVEADIQELLFNENGEIYIEQARLNGGRWPKGTLYFENDPVPWDVELALWRDDAIEAARLSRVDTTQFNVLSSVCGKWRFETDRLSCERGAVSSGGYSGSIGVEDAGFSVGLPVRAGAPSWRPIGDPPVSVLMHGSTIAMRCNADLSRCSGTGVVPIERSDLYWHGEVEWRDGAVRPVKAALHQQPSTANAQRDPRRDTRMASCERFDDPVNCGRGQVFWRDGSSFAGGWTYVGATYGGEGGTPARYVVRGEHYVQPKGWGTITYSDGKWAEVHVDSDGDLDRVGKCDQPSDSASFTCELDGRTVVFNPEGGGNRREARRREVQQVYSPQPSAPTRFVPLVVPQRPVYVLPGMR